MFTREYKINVKNLIKNEYAHNPEDGDSISKIIIENYKGDCKLILDFDEISSVNTAFANKIINALYENYSSEILNNYFELKNYNKLILDTFLKVIENYKEVKK